MIILKRVIYHLMAITICFNLIPNPVFASTKSAKTVPVSSVWLSFSSTPLAVGKTLKLTATVVPYNATNKKLAWSSSGAQVEELKKELKKPEYQEVLKELLEQE